MCFPSSCLRSRDHWSGEPSHVLIAWWERDLKTLLACTRLVQVYTVWVPVAGVLEVQAVSEPSLPAASIFSVVPVRTCMRVLGCVLVCVCVCVHVRVRVAECP